jgi:carbon-monoxide dehydrogenase small subunit
VIRLVVNGAPLALDVPARTHLADALREAAGLTGTHLGCEQGVCGACTLLLDGVPVRSCLISAHEAEGADVTTIEGLDADPVAAALRDAFTRHHALQCGYCTPGMIVTARDIVLRLGGAPIEEARIREELAGNLCRCTGYRGIVRAVAEVAAAPAAWPERVHAAAPVVERRAAPAAPPVVAADLPHRLVQEVPLALGVGEAWAILADPARLAACVPGIRLTAVGPGEAVAGEFAVALGPFQARFAGEGRFTVDAAARRGALSGRGRDGANGAEGEVLFVLRPEGEGSLLTLDLGWRLTGPLAQFSRPALLRGVVAAVAGEVAGRMEEAARGVRTVRRAGWLARVVAWLAGRFGAARRD